MATETVTVVFTDLVGSTALMSEVGEEAAEALRREHFALLRGAFEPAGFPLLDLSARSRSQTVEHPERGS